METPEPKPHHILITEDEEDIRETLRDFFQDEGYQVSTAMNGREALTLMEKNLNPDLILLDLMMPVMNGSEFLGELKLHPEWEKTQVIIMSADNQTKQKALALNIQSFVKKPLDLDYLTSVMDSMLQ